MVVGLFLQVDIGFAFDEGERLVDAVNAFNAYRYKPDSKLIEAAKKGNLEELRGALDESKVSIDDISEESSMTALTYASRSGHKDMVILLLNKGASPHMLVGSWRENTSLREAVTAGHKEIVKLLLDKQDGVGARLSMDYALIEAAKKGSKDMVEQLLDKGADPSAEGNAEHDKSFTGSTALIVASDYGHKDIVQLLLNRGANLHMTNICGNTALMIASWCGHKDIVQLLLDRGANPHSRNLQDSTALDLAKRNGHKEIVRLLNKAMSARIQKL